jgi:NACalpha-BTF3-like transcription factor
VEEKSNAADAQRTQAALSSLSASSSSSSSTNTNPGTDSAPAPVIIREEDWKLLVEECEVTKDVAESWLKANGGDINKTIQAYLHGTLTSR